ncbi:universal stress protein [Variovorax paradoxus]|uniref:TRAP-T-associated universal stress protein TeaD n=1 Tax=Variovorax paradoxus TaxID=34073 RepID=A0A0H2LSJ1_VARPD|nr:universal stress protein [Variovorax paradoxus]KLN53184.1 TRAP-T-associated universal stress protein TeaD [Variovorax paradoxus]
MKILVATDGSKYALRAVKYAAKLIGWLRPAAHSITLISVHDNTNLRFANSILGSEDVIAFLHQRSTAELKAAMKFLKTADIDHRSVIRTGHVAQEIVRFAKEGKFDLIVLGSKGRSAIVDLLLGSVAQRVLATARQPVVLVK